MAPRQSKPAKSRGQSRWRQLVQTTLIRSDPIFLLGSTERAVVEYPVGSLPLRWDAAWVRSEGRSSRDGRMVVVVVVMAASW